MKRLHHSIIALFVLACVAGCDEDGAEQSPTATGEAVGEETMEAGSRGTMDFADAEIFIEFNATANDAGIQVFLDAEAWKEIEISHRGRELLEIEASGGMKELGLTELRFEGAEPEPDEVLAAFPAGEYRFRGKTIDRFRLVGSATLSHDLPPAPDFSPSDGEVVDPDQVVIEWTAMGGVDRYQVIVESDDNPFVLEVSVSSETTELHVPPTFLEANTEYKVEILAIAPSGNRTITEGTFVTGP